MSQGLLENPKVGDVYTIRKDEKDTTRYYFLRVANIHSDTIVAYHNSLEYSYFVSKLNYNDYYSVKKTTNSIFTKSGIKKNA